MRRDKEEMMGLAGPQIVCFPTPYLLSLPLSAVSVMPGSKIRGLDFALRYGYEQPKGLGWRNKWESFLNKVGR